MAGRDQQEVVVEVAVTSGASCIAGRHRGCRRSIPTAANAVAQLFFRANDADRTGSAGMSENRRVAPLRCVAIAVQEALPMRHELSFPHVAAACAAPPSVPR